MVFKRRDRKPLGKRMLHLLWPQGGWARAFAYMRHRISRLPASPEQIGRGIAAGVFAAFTPLYGFHFLLAVVLAMAVRGNVLAAAFATLFGNPLTYVPIGIVCLSLGNFLMGRPPSETGTGEAIMHAFGAAGSDLWFNLKAAFTPTDMDWGGLVVFWHDIFVPYTIGGLIPGIVAGVVCYRICVPLIRAYRARRASLTIGKKKSAAALTAMAKHALPKKPFTPPQR